MWWEPEGKRGVACGWGGGGKVVRIVTVWISHRQWWTPNTRVQLSTGPRVAPGQAHGPQAPTLGLRAVSVYPA